MKDGALLTEKRPDRAPGVLAPQYQDVVERSTGIIPAGPDTLRSQMTPIKGILYAEDDDVLRKITTKILTGTGYRVTAVNDGLAAWKALHTTDFDLLLTDNDMPGMSGLELAARVRSKRHDLRIIVTTASADFLRSRDYDWLRFAACLQKPFSRDELLAAIDLVLRPAPSSGF